MNFAYADPPYPGQAVRHYAGEAAADGRVAREVNHALLIRHLCDEFPDGWALSTSSVALQKVLMLCPPTVRVMAWVKPFCSWKPNLRVPYAWEPVIVCGGRSKGGKGIPSVRDYVAANITTQRGVHGAKPSAFCFWLFGVLGVQSGDTLCDLFPGSGAVTSTLTEYLRYAEGLGL